jgi:hypothetical protein
VFSEEVDNALYGEYILEFRYCDIQGTLYKQKYPFIISKVNGKVQQQMNLKGQQEIIREENQHG